MLRRCSSAVHCNTAATAAVARRFFLEGVTKGSPYMKHLDLYARRDPQLAPFLLREVDIEYKRKNRKVQFCMWVSFLTFLLAYQYRLQAEELSYLKHYAEFYKAEQDARDEDATIRRRAFVVVSNFVKDAFDSKQKWSSEDSKKCTAELRSQLKLDN